MYSAIYEPHRPASHLDGGAYGKLWVEMLRENLARLGELECIKGDPTQAPMLCGLHSMDREQHNYKDQVDHVSLTAPQETEAQR